MTPAQLDIARRIAALPWFRWMDGMAWHTPRPAFEVGRVIIEDEVTDWVHPGAVPILHDPATEGCLHKLACERNWTGAVQIHVLLDIAPRMTGPGGMWRAVDARGRIMASGRIPTAILSALPYHPHAAAVCAALLHEAP